MDPPKYSINTSASEQYDCYLLASINRRIFDLLMNISFQLLVTQLFFLVISTSTDESKAAIEVMRLLLSYFHLFPYKGL